jgi:hypothetical protein
MRLPQNTWFFWLSRMMPTLGLKPISVKHNQPQIFKLSDYASRTTNCVIGSFPRGKPRRTETPPPCTNLRAAVRALAP